MTKRLLPFILILLLLIVASPVHAQKSFFWEQFDVEIFLRENGDLDVTERQTINFSGGDFTFGFATIPYNRLDEITNITVREGDVVFTESRSNEPYTFSTDYRSDEVEIEWNFPATQGTHTYTFSYTVEGAVRVEETGNQILWMAVPPDMLATVQRSSATINLPEGVNTGSTLALINGQEDESVAVSVSENGRRVTFRPNSLLYSGETLEVGVRFPTDQLPLSAPNWQGREQINDVIGLAFLLISILVLIGGLIGTLMMWFSRGRDPEVGLVAEYITEPPSDLSPALVGTLVDEKADMRDIVAIIIDLAHRGYLQIDEQKRDHLFILTDKPRTNLRSFESKFIKDFFGKKDKRKLSSLRYKFASSLPALRNMLYDELTQAQMFNKSPEKVRNQYRGAGCGILVLAFLSMFGLGALFEGVIPTAVCLPMAIFPIGALFLFIATHMPKKTLTGAEEAAKWEAFREYLKNIERYTDLKQATDVFERYLPYAVAFGLDRSWIRKFSRIETTPVPTWYGPIYGRPYYGGGFGRSGRTSSAGGGEAPTMPTLEGMSGGLTGGLDSMSKGLTRMLNSSATVLKSTKSSSSSSGSFGGGGFSGGFSGGSSGGGSRGFG